MLSRFSMWPSQSEAVPTVETPVVNNQTLDFEEWTPEGVARAYGSSPMNVSLMTPNGVRAASEYWPFARWVAVASSLGGVSSNGAPYLRNLSLPEPLLQSALKHTPFRPECTACTLFAGASTASSELHSDDIRNALLVVHGTKLVVLVGRTALPYAEVAALNAVIAARASSGGFPIQPQRFGWMQARRGAPAVQSASLGSLEVNYVWLI